MCFPEQVILRQNSLEHDFPSAACILRCLSLPQKRWISHDRTTFLIRRSTLLYQNHRGCVLWHSIFPSHLDKWCFFLLLCQDTMIKGSQRRKSLLCPELQKVSPWWPCWPTWQQTGRRGAREAAESSYVETTTTRQRKELTGMAWTFKTWNPPTPTDTPPPTWPHLQILPKEFTDFRPSIQTREPMGPFSFQPSQGTNPGREGCWVSIEFLTRTCSRVRL